MQAPSKAADSSREWQVHLAARHPRRALAAGAVAAATSLAAGRWFGAWAGLAAGALLAGALAEFLLPVRYRISTEGADARHLWPCGRIAWRRVRRRTFGADGVYLSPFAHPSRLDAVRGVRLRFPAENASDVLDAVRRFHATASQEASAP